MTKDKDNISYIHSDAKQSSGEKAAAWSSRYIPPKTSRNQSEFFQLPPNDQIIKDLLICGGVFTTLLSKITEKEDEQAGAAVMIMQQIGRDKASQEEFDEICISAERAAVRRGRDEIVRLSRTRGNAQLGALKLLQEFRKDFKGTGATDPMDGHLDGMEEDSK